MSKRMVDSEATTAGAIRQSVEARERCPLCNSDGRRPEPSYGKGAHSFSCGTVFRGNGEVAFYWGECQVRELRWIRNQLAESKGQAVRWERKARQLEIERNRWIEVANSHEEFIARRILSAPRFDLVSHLYRQRAFSQRTFGPGERASGIIAHIRKELDEIESDPKDLFEWIDVVILAFDGAWRQGWEPEQITQALAEKQSINEQRSWPDWRTVPEGEAIEHIDDGADLPGRDPS